MLRKSSTVALALVAALIASADGALACPVCFGQTDSPMAAGMNWAILLLLVITGGVLFGFVSFFVYLFKRQRAILGEPIDVAGSAHRGGSY